MQSYFKTIDRYYSYCKLLCYQVLLAFGILILDILNLPTYYYNLNNKLAWIILGTALVLVIIFCVNYRIIEAYKIISVNWLDSVGVVMGGSAIIYLGVSYILNISAEFKIIISIIVMFMAFLLISTRMCKFEKKLKLSDEYISNGIDLNDIYNNNFELRDNSMILLEEKDVDYDLLQRGEIVDRLLNAIMRSNPVGKFVISLEGKWGSGKTTILNIVKKKILASVDNIIWIDEFDPWLYSDSVSLYYNMFDCILRKSGFQYSTLSIRKIIGSVADTIFGKERRSSIWDSLSFGTNEFMSIHEKINDYLKGCDKKVVFVIDNIDRTEEDNIILLFNLISNILDFERITYVLSFDIKRVNQVLEDSLKINQEYLKKVIQMQINVPQISKDVKDEVYKRCIHNILLKYGEKAETFTEYDRIMKLICNEVNDLRDYKRLINSVINFPYLGKSFLNKKDMLSIEIIRFLNPELYSEIYHNPQYFVSFDKIAYGEIYRISFEESNFNNNRKEFFDNLFHNVKNTNYMNVLAELFPNVEGHLANQPLQTELVIANGSYAEVTRKAQICSGKYFDFYFSNTENTYVKIKYIVDSFLDSINNTNNFQECVQLLEVLKSSVHQSYQKEVFERIQVYEDDFHQNVRFNFAFALFKVIPILNNSLGFFSLSAQTRTELTVWNLLLKITENEFDAFINNINDEYAYIGTISGINYWAKNGTENKTIKGRKEIFGKTLKAMGEKIINKKIDVYTDEYYSKGNIWGIARLYRENNGVFKEYISGIMSKVNIFRIIYDIVIESFSGIYKYSISKENLNAITTYGEIDCILQSTTPKTDAEKFVLNVYNYHKEHPVNNDIGDIGIFSIDEFRSKL